jgi:acyl carrier protein
METSDMSRLAGADLNLAIREVLDAHARLPVDGPALDDDTDLFRAGMSSHASVNVMLALEDRFDIEFPDEMLRRGVFETVAAISAAVATLTDEQAV